jgi:hypothetical protein
MVMCIRSNPKILTIKDLYQVVIMPITIDNKAKKKGGNDDCFNICFGHKLIEQGFL